MGKHIDMIDKRLETMKLPRNVSRSLRKMSQREYFHAYEWKYILLFAAYPMLHDILEERFALKFYFIFVCSDMHSFVFFAQIFQAFDQVD